jgi:peptidoglycan/xylan/chitin deacetylase (PgdA/CDA1 family)
VSRGALVLTYHRIASGRDPLGQCVAPERFADHVTALGGIGEIVPLAELGSSHSSVRVALTFDDGYACNARVAAPILREAGVPATFFIPSRVLDDRSEYWWDRLEHAHFDGRRAAVLDVAPAARRVRIDVRDDAGRLRSIKALSRRLRPLRLEEIEAMVDAVEAQFGATRVDACDVHRLLGRDELALLADDPLFEIGSHGVSHTMLTALSPPECDAELAGSRTALEAATGRSVTVLAYPFGTWDAFDEATMRSAQAAGYEAAYANIPGSLADQARLRRPRHMVHDWSPDGLLANVRRWLARL